MKGKRGHSVRRNCRVLGFRRQTYYRRLTGHRPEESDQKIADLLKGVTTKFVAWGFWMVFHYLRRQGHTWNHSRVWQREGVNLKMPPNRRKIKRTYIGLLAPVGYRTPDEEEKLNKKFYYKVVAAQGNRTIRIYSRLE